MVWSYDGDPTGDRKDEVRMMVGDTVQADPLLQDEEITYILNQHDPDVDKPAWLAAAAACDSIAGKYARQAQQSIGSLSRSAQQRFEHYRQMAMDFRMLYATNGLGNATGFAGIKAGAPILSGGGKTYLGSSNYADPEGL